MSIKWWIPLALILTACPSPEDGEGETQAGPGNAAGQGGGPGGGPGGGAAGGPGGVFDDVTGTVMLLWTNKPAKPKYPRTTEQRRSGICHLQWNDHLFQLYIPIDLTCRSPTHRWCPC